MIYRSLIAIVALSVSASAMAGFSIDSAGAISTQHGAMGSYEPAEKAAAARFRGPAVNNGSVQKRYRDAELLVDLAYTPLTERGDGKASLVAGFADDVPFAAGMSMVVPRGWHIYKDPALESKAIPERISYIGDKEWPEVLRDMGDKYTLHFHVDWYDHTVMLSKGRPSLATQANKIAVIAEPSPVNQSEAAVVAKGSLPKPELIGKGNSTAGELEKVAPIVKVEPPKPVIPTWSVTVADKTFREALARWAKTAKWTFEPEHWTVPVDIPLTASATFRGDFKTAVQQMISSTELSETPLQPCFYSNRVVRVVPYNEMCDRMSAR